jgi:hypothetical protein
MVSSAIAIMHPSVLPVEFIDYTKSDCLIHYLPIISSASTGFRVLKNEEIGLACFLLLVYLTENGLIKSSGQKAQQAED